MRPATRRIVPAVLVAALLTGCADPEITDEASAALDALVDATWDAAEAGEVDAARGHLDDLRARAQQLREDGELDEHRLEEVLAAADAVAEQLGVLEAEPEPQEPVDDADEGGVDDEGDEDEKDEKDGKDEDERKEAEEEAREEAEKAQEQERKREEKERKQAEKDDDD